MLSRGVAYLTSSVGHRMENAVNSEIVPTSAVHLYTNATLRGGSY